MKYFATTARLIVGTLLLTAMAAAAQDIGEPYVLGPDDRVRVTVYGIPELSGEFRISPSGAVALPLAGDVMAAGATTAELARRITERLGPLLSLTPNTTIAVVSRRPVYVLGAVEAPGAYEYTPRMRVLQVVARAGGLRTGPVQGDDFGLRRIDAEADLARLAAEFQQLRARQARLEAERGGADTLDMPPAEASPAFRTLMEQEAALLALRRGSLDQATEQLEALKSEYRRELNALATQAETKREEIALLNELFADQEGLLERGLVRQARLLEFQRQILAAQAALHEIGAFEARARQSILRIDKEIADFRAAQAEEALTGLRDIAGEAAALRAAVAAAERRLEQLGGAAPEIGRATFRVQRDANGTLEEFPITADELLHPGDLVIVDVLRISSILGFPDGGAVPQVP